jgi:hypothetical protein
MRTRCKILCLLTISTLAANSQDRAPTKDQCRADYSLWSSAATLSGKDIAEALDKLSAEEISKRAHEMAQCFFVDSARSAQYNAQTSSYNLALRTREENFLRRHRLLNQFLDEDAQGLR